MSTRSSSRNKRSRDNKGDSSGGDVSDGSTKSAKVPNSGISTHKMDRERDATASSAMPSKEDLVLVQSNSPKSKIRHIETNKNSSGTVMVPEVSGEDLVGMDRAATTESSCDLSSVVASKDLSASHVGLTHRGQSVSFDMVLPEEGSRFDPEQINDRVEAILKRWENLTPMQPDVFLFKLLETRGYDTSVIPAREYRVPPTAKQMEDYNVELVDAVRLSNVEALKDLKARGVGLNACNKYSESVLHMAARRSNYETVKFILDNGGDIGIVDDYGRTPLHDACWRNDVSFDVITALLNMNLDLLRTADVRGACPLSYVREEFWMHWCAYFFNQKEKYWNYKVDEEGKSHPAPHDPLEEAAPEQIIPKSAAASVKVEESVSDTENSPPRRQRRLSALRAAA